MHQLAKYLRTALAIRHTKAAGSLLCGFLLLAACGTKTRDTAETYADISQQIDRGYYSQAGQAARKAWLRSPDSEWGWRFKLQHILTLLYTLRYDEAEVLLKQDLPPRYAVLRPRYQYLKANFLDHKGDPSAPALLQSAIDSARAQSDPVTEAEGLLLMAGDYTRPSAQQNAERALTVAQRNRLPFKEAAAKLQLGWILLNRERFADAIPYFQQAASLSRQLDAHYLQAASLGNLGECFFSLGDLDQALHTLEEVRRLLRPTDPANLRVNVSGELGSLYSLRRQNSEALQYFREAFAIAKTDPTLSVYSASAENLAQALIEDHQFDEAEKYNQLASQAPKSGAAPNLELQAYIQLNRAGIAAARGQLKDAERFYRNVSELLKKDPPSSIQWSGYAQLAVVEERLGKTNEARRNFEMALRTIESNRSTQRIADYQITFLSSLIRFYQQYVDFLIRQNQPWNALAVADSSRASVLTQGLLSSREQTGFAAKIHNEARASGSALLFYWLSPEISYLWAITPTGDVFQKLPRNADIQRDVESYSAFIQGERQDTLEARNTVGLRLYQTLLGGVASHLRPGMRVVVVPDGALHSLNFETLLVNGPKPHYWIEDVGLTVAPSLGILLTGAKRSQSQIGARIGALVIGDPIYTGTDYPPLPESRREVSEVSARFPQSAKVLTQRNALRSAYANAQPGSFSFIHFSAHVDADTRSPLDSAIILSPGEGGSRLYARDVMAVPLHADLVTFSGCRSVGAKVLSGEGMVGFAWAAFQAGARNAVTSLWAVDDRSTADLMDRFYDGVTHGKPYASALRDAKLQMLTSPFKKPYYWAPFQLYSRNIESK